MSTSAGYRETFRGHVPAWHCDAVEHFTVAYYFERLEKGYSPVAPRSGARPNRCWGASASRLLRSIHE